MKFKLSEHYEGDFLPDLCTHQAVFSLILVGELLSFAFVIIDRGFTQFDWTFFGAVSFLVQWIVIASAACLCPLRPWLKEQNGLIAGTVSYSIVLVLTVVLTLFGQWLSRESFTQSDTLVWENLVISAIFAGVVLRYFYLQQQLTNREQAELRSRIQALQSRIRPHFLFNSMNSIASLIDIDPAAAEKMVIDLSHVFRASLNESAMVTLAQEIKLCEQFISIEKTRLGDRLKVQWDVNIDKDVKIPSLLLQPIIENAIYHGIQPLEQGGVVEICISSENDKVKITVKNPFDEKALAGRSGGNGIALENIKHRLEAYFGDESELSLSAEDDTYNVVILYPSKYQEQ